MSRPKNLRGMNYKLELQKVLVHNTGLHQWSMSAGGMAPTRNQVRGGAAYGLFKKGELVQYGTRHSLAYSAFQMEALALLIAMQAAQSQQIADCIFYSDSAELVQTVQRKNPQSVDWRAHWEVAQVGEIMARVSGYRCVYVNREGNSLAHNLANLARVDTLDIVGFTFPSFKHL